MDSTGEVLQQPGEGPDLRIDPYRKRVIVRSLNCPFMMMALEMYRTGALTFEEAICWAALTVSEQLEQKNKQLVQIEMERETGAAAEIKTSDERIAFDAVVGTRAMPPRAKMEEPPEPIEWPAASVAISMIRKLVDDTLNAGANSATQDYIRGCKVVARRMKDILNIHDLEAGES